MKSHNIKNGSQGAMANDKEMVKKMRSVKLGTADMINMMKKILMIMDEMQISLKDGQRSMNEMQNEMLISFEEHNKKMNQMVEEHCTKTNVMVEEHCTKTNEMVADHCTKMN